jgi:maltokinase
VIDAAGLVAAAEPAALLPARRAEEAARMSRPLRLIEDRWLGSSPHGELHHLLIEDGRGIRYGIPSVVGPDSIRRAVPGDGAASSVVASIDPAARGRERGIPVDQTNELVVVGDAFVVKWYLNPAVEGEALHRMDLLATAGFTGTPAVLGRLLSSGGQLTALVMAYRAGASDGWEWLVDDVRAEARGEDSEDPAAISTVGDLVARLHLAFSAEGVGHASVEDARRWHAAALADVEGAGLDDDLSVRVRERLAPIEGAAGTPTIPIHGDLHVGQVLRSSGKRYDLIDFDGNPVLPAAERFAPAPAARDVAGMLASLDHVGRVVMHRAEDLDDRGRRRVLEWIPVAQAAFLGAYESRLASAGALDLLDRSLLVPFMVQQECREYIYAARYLPHWRYVPDAALPGLLTKESM